MSAQAVKREEEGNLLRHADELCRQNNLRLTPIRERVYRELVQSGGPMGAYDLVDRLSNEKKRLAPVTIYRALEFLQHAGLVHRLATKNSYVVSHGELTGNNTKIMFVDTKTGNTVEVHSAEVAEAIQKAAEQVGFKSVHPFVEVEGELSQ
ncbi:Fur family transcriptional regulator [Microvirga guangxiensis]|uniref:Fur family transcriptional regulator, zinc uptake regulator n=1 Tax=Microvirga guangxiensis TaxID=549386 RepID=A0A1G5LJ51_9HYPH|nr:transcriptional repressor [Microvirga guangxiensis]SCZ12654.1 Fur family transcriptional regulator, zinc uptake regulator [Microvirga guangxiensis]